MKKSGGLEGFTPTELEDTIEADWKDMPEADKSEYGSGNPKDLREKFEKTEGAKSVRAKPRRAGKSDPNLLPAQGPKRKSLLLKKVSQESEGHDSPSMPIKKPREDDQNVSTDDTPSLLQTQSEELENSFEFEEDPFETVEEIVDDRTTMEWV